MTNWRVEPASNRTSSAWAKASKGPERVEMLQRCSLMVRHVAQDLFSPFGNISRIYIAYDRETGENRGFAFVNFVFR